MRRSASTAPECGRSPNALLLIGSIALLNEAAARGGRFRAQGSARSSRLRAMNNIHSNPSPLRQKFIEYLTLNRKAERTVHTYVSFIYSLAKHCRRSPDLLGPEDIRQWLYHLIAERKQAASTVNLAINAVRSFFGGLLQREIEPLLHQIKRPRRPALAPRLYSMAEVEKLLTVGTEGNLRARAFLSCVYGGGLRLSEATHIQIKD